jgi:RNA recognition motif-containing protein
MACKFDPLSNCDDLNKELQKLLKKVESGMYNEEEFEHRFKEIQDRLLHCKDDFFEKEYFPKEKNSNFHQFRKAYLEKNRITHNTIIVQNLHPEVTEYLLYWLFNQSKFDFFQLSNFILAGKIDSVVIRSKNRNDRYSYIEYIDPENIDRAIEIMNDYPILDRVIQYMLNSCLENGNHQIRKANFQRSLLQINN